MSAIERLEHFAATTVLNQRQSLRWHEHMRKACSGAYDDTEKQRVWLESVIADNPGYVLNIGVGDMPIAGTEGIDTDTDVLGLDCFASGDDLSFCEDNSVDCIVTNYLEAFSDAYKVFEEWSRVLKVGGTVAIVCVNADTYDPFRNSKKFNCFTSRTLMLFLQRSGMAMSSVESVGDNLYVTAYKKGEAS